ncbi:hypothetical protein [Amycolatopsis sp. Poz14]|uniref:hypothetical protein n=1 Tax=Amycolatopsis sp. Poz14 TaxID=1447705 RepID=UPI001EE994D5|nr:hypothetical protein [Amycolatopsis sp. Poz14]MCG3756687.1 hypothetical protein [Amycolatopsis sp. Poz14]
MTAVVPRLSARRQELLTLVDGAYAALLDLAASWPGGPLTAEISELEREHREHADAITREEPREDH